MYRPLGKRQVVPSSSAACFGCTAMRCGCEVFAKRGSSVEDVPPEPGISAQNKTPQTQLSHGTLVDQPSPKCCSKTRLGQGLRPVNGTNVTCHTTNVPENLPRSSI